QTGSPEAFFTHHACASQSPPHSPSASQLWPSPWWPASHWQADSPVASSFTQDAFCPQTGSQAALPVAVSSPQPADSSSETTASSFTNASALFIGASSGDD